MLREFACGVLDCVSAIADDALNDDVELTCREVELRLDLLRTCGGLVVKLIERSIELWCCIFAMPMPESSIVIAGVARRE